MKGFSHFASGLAVASFFPSAATAAGEGMPWYFVLGGAAALWADTFDFKFLRFIHRHDRETAPDVLHPDPDPIAATIARAVNDAAATGRPVTVKLNTVPLAGSCWQQYNVELDPANHAIGVSIGPVVSTSQTAVRARPQTGRAARAATEVEAIPGYLANITVDILDGPVLEMRPRKDGRVRVDFIPWHRTISHSLVVGLLLGILAAAVWNPIAGAIVFAAHSAHVLVDQLGFMGSALWYPFSRRRTPGLKRLRAMDPFANATLVWTCLLLIFWNLARNAGPDLAYGLPQLLFFGGALPLIAVRFLTRY